MKAFVVLSFLVIGNLAQAYFAPVPKSKPWWEHKPRNFEYFLELKTEEEIQYLNQNQSLNTASFWDLTEPKEDVTVMVVWRKEYHFIRAYSHDKKMKDKLLGVVFLDHKNQVIARWYFLLEDWEKVYASERRITEKLPKDISTQCKKYVFAYVEASLLGLADIPSLKRAIKQSYSQTKKKGVDLPRSNIPKLRKTWTTWFAENKGKMNPKVKEAISESLKIFPKEKSD